jgi:hypothetical protein
MDRRPAWLWPNLISLDAPLVAVAWLWMFAKTWRVVWLPDVLPWLVGGAVWCIYVADRLLDQRNSVAKWRQASSRHAFHSKHKKLLSVLLVIMSISCCAMLGYLPTSLWAHGALILLFVVAYFFTALLQDGEGVPVVKNFLAGMTFAYGTSVGIHFYRPDSNLFFFLFSPEVLMFGLLCILNITAIDVWEASRERAGAQTWTDGVLSILFLALGAAAMFLAARGDVYNKPFFLAVFFAAGSLYLVDRLGRFGSLDAQRVLADVAMLLPLPFFILYTWNL